MKIIAISDTHNRQKQIVIPQCDVLVHAGDLTMGGTLGEVTRALIWLGEQKVNGTCKEVVLIAGNHDWLAERDPDIFKRLCEENGLHYLNDSGVEIDGVKFWGSPVQPEFFGWAFNRARTLTEAAYKQIKEIRQHWDLIPDGTDVLITHGPPHKVLDLTPRNEQVGCEELFKAVMRVKPKLNIFGHIHHSYGETVFMDTKFVNASICDEQYVPSKKPIEVEI